MDGWMWRDRRQREWGAWLTANLLSPWSKDPIAVSALMGEAPPDPVDKEAFLDERLKEWEAQRAESRGPDS